MKGIVRVIEGSEIISKTVKEVEEQFGIKIIGRFNPFPSQGNIKEAKPDDLIYPDLCLQVEGNYEEMKNFSLATVNF